MPKPTFFNLPEDKKESLVQAAKKEFSRVPLFEASISNIIKSAGIPRGSFYQYFEDKEDTYFYLLREFAKEKKTAFLSILKKQDGDLFETFIEFFDSMIREEDNTSFIRNALLNMSHKIESTFESMISSREVDEDIKAFSKINTSNLRVSTDKELFHAIQIITSIFFRNLIQTYANELPYEEAMENYRLEINMVKNGLSR